MSNTIRVETWSEARQGRDERGRFTEAEGHRRRSRVVVRTADGTFHGATNFRQASRVGQVANARRR